MRILGISALYHDSAAAVVVDGEVVAAAQEERFTRKKHDARFPRHAIAYCSEHCGCKVSDFDAVVFYEKPLIKFERLLETYLSFAPRGFSSFRMAMPVWLREKLFQKRLLAKELQKFAPEFDAEKRLLFSEHHLSHAASAFYPSPFEEAAVLTMDGVGEWSTTSLALGQGKDLKVLKEMHFPHSIGLLYSAFTYYLGFKVNSGEYKVMGLAPYGEPRYAQKILDAIVDLKSDGSFRLDQKYFDYCTGLTMTNGAFARLFGQPVRDPASELLTQFHMDMAASIQAVTEEVVLRLARSVRAETGQRRLCLAGGVALNCVANGKILREGIFDELVGAAGLGRCRRRAGGGARRLSHVFRSPAQAQRRGPRRHARLLPGPRLRAAGDRDGVDGGRRQVRNAGRRRPARDDGAGAGRWQGRGLDAGPHGVWARARSAHARSWATRARPACRRRSISRSNTARASARSRPPCCARRSAPGSSSTPTRPTCCWWRPCARSGSGR